MQNVTHTCKAVDRVYTKGYKPCIILQNHIKTVDASCEYIYNSNNDNNINIINKYETKQPKKRSKFTKL